MAQITKTIRTFRTNAEQTFPTAQQSKKTKEIITLMNKNPNYQLSVQKFGAFHIATVYIKYDEKK